MARGDGKLVRGIQRRLSGDERPGANAGIQGSKASRGSKLKNGEKSEHSKFENKSSSMPDGKALLQFQISWLSEVRSFAS
jgi:hypothetical protein